MNSNINELDTDSCENEEYFCKNSIGNFVNRFNRRVNLKGSWEVALTNIQYRKSWFNVREDQTLELFGLGREYRLSEKFPSGNYPDPQDLIDELNDLYGNVREASIEYAPQFTYNRNSNTVSIRVGKKITSEFLIPKVSKYLADYLGLPYSSDEFKTLNEKLVSSVSQNYQISSQKNQQPASQTKDASQTSKPLPDSQQTDQPVQNQLHDATESEKKVKISSDIAITIDNTDPSKSTFDIPGVTDTHRKKPEQPAPTRRRKVKQEKLDLPPEDVKFDPRIRVSQKANRDFINDSPSLISANQVFTWIHMLKEVSLHGPTDTLYIYCSLVQPTLIANVEAQLIRRVGVPSDKKFRDLCEVNYTSKEYYPLLFNEFDRIEIDIQDDSGKTVDFRFGKVALTLHFRKKFTYGH